MIVNPDQKAEDWRTRNLVFYPDADDPFADGVALAQAAGYEIFGEQPKEN